MYYAVEIINDEERKKRRRRKNLNMKIKSTRSAKNVGTLSSVLSMTFSWYWRAGRNRTSLRIR